MSSGAPASPVDLLGIPFWPVTEAETVAHIVEEASAGRGGWLVTPNLEILRQCESDAAVHAMVRRADVIVADGMPLIWASRLQGGRPLPERVCGSNLVSSLSAEASARGLRVYLFGGADDTSERASELLRERHPGLEIVGAYGPPYGFEKDDAEMASIVERIEAAKPNIVFFALPFPKGERVLERIRHAAPDAWWCGVGVSFSFLTGDVQRAPRWMQRTGLEWIHRLSQEPKRLARRYLVDGIPFAVRLLVRAPLGRVQRRGDG
ncbi:MAG: WecB/TagA/CpsF family glycosyltransferase [Myxococcota bacterium]